MFARTNRRLCNPVFIAPRNSNGIRAFSLMSSHPPHDAERTLLATSLVDADEPLADQVADAGRRGADIVELRVDRIGDVGAVEELLRAPRCVPLILTVRTADEGGAWDGEEAERIALVERLGLLGPGYVDVEWASWRRSANLRQKVGLVCERSDRLGGDRPLNKLILSHHDLRGTPEDLDAVAEPLAAEPAAVAKLVFTARDATDALRVLCMLHRYAQRRPTIALAMGEPGLATRVLAPKFGGFLSFASRGVGRESAPGQPTLEELRGVYRWDEINPATGVYGVVGWPVHHSRSPYIHNAALRESAIDAVYLPFPVAPTPAAFERFMRAAIAPELDIRGLSVTLPHKVHALRWLRDAGGVLDEHATRCGAVNTLVRGEGGRWSGHNTDVVGALRALEHCAGLDAARLRGEQTVVLGAGGVARAVTYALVSAGAKVTIYNRTRARSEALAAEFGCRWGEWDQRTTARGRLLANCTSIGMDSAAGETPMPADALRAFDVVFDTIYTPKETQLLRDAVRQGVGVVDGVTMFVEQAARQFELWHDRSAPIEVFRTRV
ncbi:MAG: type I 3-dehydroquinate dehydratase [Planctomycetota bacterium]|nr:MAG: type I 3-dehydroquinate dehydratase [Planctomycetota bacterium]